MPRNTEIYTDMKQSEVHGTFEIDSYEIFGFVEDRVLVSCFNVILFA